MTITVLPIPVKTPINPPKNMYRLNMVTVKTPATYALTRDQSIGGFSPSAMRPCIDLTRKYKIIYG